MNHTVLKIALAGLLHDVEKFSQRAYLEKVFPEIIANYSEFCPFGVSMMAPVIAALLHIQMGRS